jgi:hypothetical protein
MGDTLREDARSLVAALRAIGVRHVAMVTGDRTAVADAVGAELGLDGVHAELEPGDKLEVVRGLRERPDHRPVVMVGDGALRDGRTGRACRIYAPRRPSAPASVPEPRPRSARPKTAVRLPYTTLKYDL